MNPSRAPRAAVRPPGTLADMPARGARQPSEVSALDRLYAADIAQLEKISKYTAGELMRSGQLGTVHGRNQRDRWVDRRAYQQFLDTR